MANQLHQLLISPDRTIDLSTPRIMAILNLTPDSFSDGGQLSTPQAAATRAELALAEGATILDIGGVSTRPGALPVSESDQIARVVPAIAAIRARVGPAPVITIDTTRSAVAQAALDSGADAVNDVSAALDDPRMLPLCASRGCAIVLMHRRTTPDRDSFSDRYTQPPAYTDVVETVRTFLAERAQAAVNAGIPRESIVLDPGLGFGKTVEQNLALIKHTPRLCELGFPILSGLSRKSFVARASGLGADSKPADRLAGSLALSVEHFRAGATIFRVHDVIPHTQALAAAQSIRATP